MATRRQEKVASLIKEVVSEAIAHHLSDPRIEGFISVTRVEMAPDLRNAEVYLSVFGQDPSVQNKTFLAVEHAKTRIQAMVAGRLQSKFCPVLHFHKDEQFKKTLDIMRLIDQAASEYRDKDEQENSDDETS